MNTAKAEVRSDLKKLILPTLSGMLVTFMFQLVDTYFIGKLGEIELAAISFTYPIYIMIISVFMGLAVGVSASVGHSYGKGENNKIKSLTTSAIITTLLAAIVFNYVIYLFRENIYTLLGVAPSMFSVIDDYIVVILIGMPFLVVALNAIASLRSTGKALVPELIMALGGIINLILDYVLIFGAYNIKPMGIKGAALATVISWIFVSIIILLLLLKHKYYTFNLNFFDSNKLISKVALPAIGVQLITPVSMAIITKFVASKGELSVAALGIATKIESLSLTIILALSIVIVPLAAKHFAASNDNHFDEVIALAGKISSYWSFVLYIVILIFSKPIAAIFTSSPVIIDMVSKYLLIVGLAYPFIGITLVTNSLFNAVDKSKESLKITVIKYIFILVPAVFIGNNFGINGIWIALSVSNLVGGLYASKLFRKWLSSQNSSLNNVKLREEYKKDFKKIINKIHS